MLVEVRDAQFGYNRRAVVRVPYLALRAGRCVGIFGPNGTGKTTLVRGITGLIRPMAGTVERGMPTSRHAATLDRRGSRADVRFAYMPQQRGMDLLWPMTGLDAASLATSARRRFGWMGGQSSSVLQMMRKLGVDDLARRSFAKMSGGQQQRILLAGAMASNPDVLVLDEPTDGLDILSTRTLLELLKDFTAAGLCTVIISHEVEDLLFLGGDVAWLHPADSPGEPSAVEVILPNELANRMTQTRART